MVHHDASVTRYAHVEFDTVGTTRDRLLKRRQCVLGRERGSASMRENERTR